MEKLTQKLVRNALMHFLLLKALPNWRTPILKENDAPDEFVAMDSMDYSLDVLNTSHPVYKKSP